ncbi:lycopene cyclase family protein [Nocardia arizonensis]|uniref:lycopene cyclase family protein n=1 Tax=Nocardia arizonensis TaxID=1141647 RepID=UPI0006D16A84|nr:lycopene cyclase family protein [Nocardia arizonensis]
MSADIVICGAGPAGRALAHRCLARGLAVTLIDPAPRRRWTATYAAWADELPHWLDPGAIAATVDRPAAWARGRHELDRRYVVFDTDRLRETLAVDGADIRADRAARLGAHTVTCASGAVLTAERVIDARGLRRAPNRAEQTAYGLVLDPRRADGVEPAFMDWRGDNGADSGAPPSFLYAVPVGGGRMLVEETCLAGRPALDIAVLRTRLLYRLRSRGIVFDGAAVEQVRFPIEGGRAGATRFGAAGGFTHPATGYSLAAALAAADPLAAGIAPPMARIRAVAALRAAGLRALLALPPADLPDFFETFFDLPSAAQRAYLGGRDDLSGTLVAMNKLFAALPPRLRRTLALATVGLPPRR